MTRLTRREIGGAGFCIGEMGHEQGITGKYPFAHM